MKKNLKLSLFLAALFVANVASAQGETLKRVEVRNGSVFANLAEQKIVTQNAANRLNELLNLNTDFTFERVLQRADEIGFIHTNFQQFYKGYPLDGQMIMLHEKDGFLSSMNGKIAQFETLDLQINISDNQAVEIAKADLGVDSLAKKHPVETVIAKIPKDEKSYFALVKKVKAISYSPLKMYNVFIDAKTGKVLNKITLINDADVAGTAQTMYSGTQDITCYQNSSTCLLEDHARNIYTYDVTDWNMYYQTDPPVFANNSTNWSPAPVLKTFTIYSTPSTEWWYDATDTKPDFYIKIYDGSNSPVYTSSVRSNQTPPVAINNINLPLSNPPYYVEVWDYNAAGSDEFGSTVNITSSTNQGIYTYQGSNTICRYSLENIKKAALDVHWGMEKTYDFYFNIFNRDSYDGNHSEIANWVNPVFYGGQYGFPNNAAALGDGIMVYGVGDSEYMKPLVAIDVVGHEFTHLVVDNNNNGGLYYQGESGALNESFADIFGACIESYARPSNANWTIGEDIMITEPFMRSMSNPSSNQLPSYYRQPDTYQGTYWVSTTDMDDNGGVHTNSGVQNFWFYLLCQGGSGTNDFGNAYSVAGIGITDARKIAYRNLMNYLSPYADHYDSYTGSLQAASDLFGINSTQYAAVQNAWYAVGIGTMPFNCSSSYVEDFNNLNGATNYSDGSFVGNNGITWNYIHCIDASGTAASPINGKSLLLRRTSENSKLYSATITNGIQSFSCKFRKAYTGTSPRYLELYINGELKGASRTIGTNSGEDATIYDFTVNNINVLGDFTIEIRLASSVTGNAQIVIDDIEWCVMSVPKPTPPVADFLADKTSIDIGETVNFTDNSTNDPARWKWTFEGGAPAASVTQNPTVRYDTAGTYSVTLTVTNADGSDTKTQNAYISVANIAGVEDILKNKLLIYPNPAKDKLHIKLLDTENLTGLDVQICDISGKVNSNYELKTADYAAGETTIDISNLPSGVYFVKMTNFVAKFIKE
ncbi:MAG: M4 family metallopeptidase [Prevotellaceae bacterium]|jgi:Zn-dependent metalloprotease/PKD repeat protein|nr:M4 family metallopeptidase [Prevotellaceae bacterium]